MNSQKFSFKQFIVPHFWRKLSFMLPAVLMMGVTLSVLILIGWGTDPASFMNLNVSAATGLSLGNTQVVVYSIMLIFTIIFGVHMIGFGTLANMILIGYVADFCRWIWDNIGFTDFVQNAGFGVKVALFTFIIILFVIVAAIYMNAQMGTAPYDALPKIISDGIPKVPFFIIRILFDFSAIGVGLLVSKIAGTGVQGSVVGSVSMSILLGPVISVISKPLEKILNK